jgi:hypothetical protein
MQVLFNGVLMSAEKVLVNADVECQRSWKRQGFGGVVAQVPLNAGVAIITGVDVDTGFNDRK